MKTLIRFVALSLATFLADGADSAVQTANPVLWREPSDISSRDLFYGSGGKKDAPDASAVFTFEKEDMDGTNPKFVVSDSEGTKWKVKLGTEAKPETAAARFVWAVGYSTNEDYFLPKITVQELPAHLKRGDRFRQPDGSFLNVRLKRSNKDDKKEGNWAWRDNPFIDTPQLDGLRVMMALINNWDLKTENNALHEGGGQTVYYVSDLGASFGMTGLNPSLKKCKGNVEQYRKSQFITKTTGNYVSFGTPSLPNLIFIFDPPQFFSRIPMEQIGRHIPREHVKWIAAELAKLNDQQIHDAFRSAGFSPEEIDAFSVVIEKRIAQLGQL